jgi:predicted tellurium resistance membrane protein TerC
MDILTYDVLLSLLTLTFLEIVLGIDNLIFIAVAVAKLPAKKRKTARMFGLGCAFVIRVIMLLTLSWVMSFTDPLFFIGENGYSFKNFLLFFGGLFLIGKSGWEIICDIFFSENLPEEKSKSGSAKNMLAAILQIIIIDFVFSFDSIITAVGMTSNIPVIVTAVIISMIAMLLASEKISYFLHNYPSLKIVALSFILMIGVILLADGIHIEISKGYLYFSLFFTLIVETLNIVARKKHKGNHSH